MQLDKRIPNLDVIIGYLDIAIGRVKKEDIIGKVGYFADNITDYYDLDDFNSDVDKGVLDDVFDTEICFRKDRGDYVYKYFILEDSLIKESYRKFTPTELLSFIENKTLLHYRLNSDKEEEYFQVINNAKVIRNNLNVDEIIDLEFHLVPDVYNLETAFNEIELYDGERWIPFGKVIKDEENVATTNGMVRNELVYNALKKKES